jgi:hypothetical protein
MQYIEMKAYAVERIHLICFSLHPTLLVWARFVPHTSIGSHFEALNIVIILSGWSVFAEEVIQSFYYDLY